ncbi:MAG: PEP-utilizing enzyme [Rivihabitans pingtungensis]
MAHPTAAALAGALTVRHLADGAMALLRQRGVLHADEGRDAVRHLFYEIDSACQGSLAAASLRARLLDRQARFARWQAETAPEYLLIQPDGQHTAGALPTPYAPSDGQRWRGLATGAGVARGRVRRIRHPAEGVALQAGEILLAPATDPGWTPLFLKAGGLVVETGGYLSHAAIVAREFALPAVVNLPGIMDALQDGEWVEVDGGRGVVRRVSNG